jgi:hypothetical protein
MHLTFKETKSGNNTQITIATSPLSGTALSMLFLVVPSATPFSVRDWQLSEQFLRNSKDKHKPCHNRYKVVATTEIIILNTKLCNTQKSIMPLHIYLLNKYTAIFFYNKPLKAYFNFVPLDNGCSSRSI